MAPTTFAYRTLVATALLQLCLFAASSPLLRHQVEGLPSPSKPRPQRRQDSDGFEAVTGIQAFGVQPRLEIRQLEQDADQWNIFLLGLARFQATDQSDKTSYYQIAGIHGRPYIPWDGVDHADGVDSPGFCTHVSNLFLTWHRPYLALFEQTLYQHIIDAVNEFPAGAVRQRYAGAALGWRWPYWDWAAAPDSGSVYPDSVMKPTVTVTMPNGTSDIPNPLFAYQFHPVSKSDFYFSPFSQWNTTMRYPTAWTSDAHSQNELIPPILDNNRVSFMDRLYNLFTNYNNFTEFSNEAWINPNVSNADSLESLHDAIHAITGSSGHMTYLDYSAFDPLFFLHHAMVDRSFAIWQALYPDSYVEPMDAVEGTYSIKVGSTQDVNSPLNPFHNDTNGDLWTPSSIRSVETFGYTYSDLGNGSAAAVRAAVNKLYGGSAGSGGLSRRATKLHQSSEREVPGAAVPEVDAPEEVTDGKYRQYLANIVSEKFALNGSFGIYVFMGDFEDDPTQWSLSPNLVGTHAVFAALSGADAAGDPQMAPRQMDTTIQVTGTMPLTSMLLTKVQSGELACMDVEAVTGYLQSSLRWRIGMFDGTQVPVEDLSQLVITVVTAEVEPASTNEDFPVWGGYNVLTNVTQGQPGGCA